MHFTTGINILLRRTFPLSFVIFITLVLQSCNLSGSLNLNKTFKNQDIDQKKRQEIDMLNHRFIDAIRNNNSSAAKMFMSDTLKKVTGNGFDSIVHLINPYFHSDKFSVLSEYNVVNTSKDATNTIRETDGDGNKYTINYLALNKDMYVSLLLIKDNVGDLLITIVYGNYGGKWKINIFRVGRYKFFGKTAMDFYHLAQADFAKSYLVDAVCNLSMANDCVNPANGIFQYNDETEYKTFFDSVFKEVKARYQFPLTFNGLSSKPKLLNIYPEIIDDGYFPLIIYLSDIKLKDTVSLKSEYEKVKTEVNQMFTGLRTDNKNIFYRVFNETPDGVRQLPYYGFIDRR